GRPPGCCGFSAAVGQSHQISNTIAAITPPITSQRRTEPVEREFASDMNWVRLEMRVNHKQSRPARKGDLRHFYVSELVRTQRGLQIAQSAELEPWRRVPVYVSFAGPLTIRV